MPSYTIRFEGRDLKRLDLSADEALTMAKAGFQFAEYNLEQRKFRLSLPYRTAQDFARGTLTFMQGLDC